MRALIVGLLALSCAALSTSGLTAAGAIVGYVSDMKCASSSAGKKSASEWIQPAAFESCVKKCVKEEHSEAVLVTEDNKILKFDAVSAKKIEPFLGNKVSVMGTIAGSTVSVDSVTRLKLQ